MVETKNKFVICGPTKSIKNVFRNLTKNHILMKKRVSICKIMNKSMQQKKINYVTSTSPPARSLAHSLLINIVSFFERERESLYFPKKMVERGRGRRANFLRLLCHISGFVCFWSFDKLTPYLKIFKVVTQYY